jgi:DNA invertase Pin-like site-specific DNA recombinase
MADVLNDKNLRVLLVARLSKLQSDGRQGMGIETQDERCREWAQREGHTVVDIAADTKSGTVSPWHRKNLKPWVTRPELMVQYDAIVAYKNDRLSRGAWEDETEIRKWAMQNGKWLIIADGGPWWPPRHDGDRWGWEAAAMQARKEWEEIRERNLRERHALAGMGKLVDRLPWGLEAAGPKYDKHPAPTQEGFIYAPKIWQKVVDGISLADICLWMDTQGVKTNTLKPGKWSPKTLLRMIRNPIYYGSKQDAHGIEVMKVPALVDASLWEQANLALSNRTRGRRGPASGLPALLTSVLFCDHCHLKGTESPMRRIHPQNRNGTYRPYQYRCWGTGPNPKGCGLNVDLDATDILAINMLSNAPEPWPEIRKIEGTSHEIARAALRLKLRELPSRDLSREEYEAESGRLWDEIDAIPEDTDGSIALVDTGDTIGQHWMKLDREGRRQMLIEHVRFYADRTRVEGALTPVLRWESHLFKMSSKAA